MRKLLFLAALFVAAVTAATATATLPSLPDHHWCHRTGTGNPGTLDNECSTIGSGTPYDYGFVYKGLQDCWGTGCTPETGTLEGTMYANATGYTSEGAGSLEHSLTYFTIGGGNGVGQWMQAGIETGASPCLNSAQPYVYVEYYTGSGNGSCTPSSNYGFKVVASNISLNTGYDMKFVNVLSNGKPTNEWQIYVNTTLEFDVTFPGQMTYAQVMGEDADYDNIADSHDDTLVGFAKNQTPVNWPYNVANPCYPNQITNCSDGKGWQPYPSNPFEIDCVWYQTQFPCASARSWLPGSINNGNQGWFTRNPNVPVTARAPLIFPGYYVDGHLVTLAVPAQ